MQITVGAVPWKMAWFFVGSVELFGNGLPVKLAASRESLIAGLVLAPVDIVGVVPKTGLNWNHGKVCMLKAAVCVGRC